MKRRVRRRRGRNGLNGSSSSIRAREFQEDEEYRDVESGEDGNRNNGGSNLQSARGGNPRSARLLNRVSGVVARRRCKVQPLSCLWPVRLRPRVSRYMATEDRREHQPTTTREEVSPPKLGMKSTSSSIVLSESKAPDPGSHSECLATTCLQPSTSSNFTSVHTAYLLPISIPPTATDKEWIALHLDLSTGKLQCKGTSNDGQQCRILIKFTGVRQREVATMLRSGHFPLCHIHSPGGSRLQEPVAALQCEYQGAKTEGVRCRYRVPPVDATSYKLCSVHSNLDDKKKIKPHWHKLAREMLVEIFGLLPKKSPKTAPAVTEMGRLDWGTNSNLAMRLNLFSKSSPPLTITVSPDSCESIAFN